MAKVMPISSTQPATSETTIELTMPLGPATAASLVSSVMCAEASYPVNVYCASRRLRSPTYSGLWKPVSLTNLVNTKLAEAWCEGQKASTTTMIPTPNTCHQTLTLLN